MRLEAQNLICRIQEILLHELGVEDIYVDYENDDDKMRLTMPAWSSNSRYVSKEP